VKACVCSKRHPNWLPSEKKSEGNCLTSLLGVFPVYKVYLRNSAGAFGWGTELQTWNSWFRFPMVSMGYLIDTILPGGPGVHWAVTEMSTRNISWEVKVAGASGWQLYHLHLPIVFTSGSINLLKPSGPVQACTGITLPFTIHIYKYVSKVDDWLTVLHRSITLVNLQLDKQNSSLFIYNTFIKILYVFRALPCSSSGGLRHNCVQLLSRPPEDEQGNARNM